AIGTKYEPEQDTVLVTQGSHFLSGGHIPESGGSVRAAAGQDLAVRMERQVVDGSRVPAKRPQLPSGLGVAQANDLVLLDEGKLPSVWAEPQWPKGSPYERPDIHPRHFQREQHLLPADIPDRDLAKAVFRSGSAIAARGEPLTIGAEDHQRGWALVST